MANITEQRLLIVDDCAAHRALIKRAVKKSEISCEVLEREGLKSARELLTERKEFSMAIIDLNLGDGSGCTLVKELRAMKEYNQLPIVVLSTSRLERDVEEAKSSGANWYLCKNEDLEVFTNSVIDAIRRVFP